MARVLITYGTTDGHTADVARALGIAVRSVGVEATVLKAARGTPGPEGYDGVIVAASLQAGKSQRPVRQWIAAHRDGLRMKPAAFVSVCLMVRDPGESAQAKLASIISGFLQGCGWSPARRKAVAGALLYTRYGWLKRRMMKMIAAKTGGDTDTTRDYVYTDWEDLRNFAREFCRDLTAREHSWVGRTGTTDAA